jgi:hypothetical protein
MRRLYEFVIFDALGFPNVVSTVPLTLTPTRETCPKPSRLLFSLSSSASILDSAMPIDGSICHCHGAESDIIGLPTTGIYF